MLGVVDAGGREACVVLGDTSSQKAFEQKNNATSANERINSCDIFVAELRLFFFDVFVIGFFINSSVYATSKD